MARYLVVYYSRTGRTAAVAEQLAAELGADIEEIREPRPRAGLLGYIRSAVESLRRRPAEILPTVENPADYDAVVLGTPVWAGALAAPVRSYVLAERARLPRVALFCTLGGSGARGALAGLASLCGRRPIAELALTAAQLAADDWTLAVRRFAYRIRAESEGADGSPAPRAAA